VAGRDAAMGAPDASRPLHWNDLDEFIQPKVEGVLADVHARGAVLSAIGPVRDALYTQVVSINSS
jgi:phenylalanine ammonia-lyase